MLVNLRRKQQQQHGRLSVFIHRVVVVRKDEAVRSWRNWLRVDPLVRPYWWLRPDLVPPAPFSEVFDVGGWLTHGDVVLDTEVDFLAVVEHRLIPARVRSEWKRPKKKGLVSFWAPACQESSYVGNAGGSSCFTFLCHCSVCVVL